MMKKINLEVYIFNAKIQILQSMEFRFDFLLSLLMNVILIFFRIFIWTTVYRGINEVEGINYDQMIIYSVMANFLAIVFQIHIESNINNNMRKGDIAYLLAKPVNMIFYWLSSDLGNVLKELLFYIIPFSFLSIFVLMNNIEIPFLSIMLFTCSSVLSYLILWGISFCVGSIAFWVVELGTINRVKDMVIFVLSGSFVPIWFFPETIQTISKYLPFEHIFQTPLGFLIGKYQVGDVENLIGIQLLWVVFFMGLSLFLWNKAKKKIIVQGG